MSVAHLTSPAFKENAKGALADPQLQSALHGIETGIVDRRRATVGKLPEFEALRNSARDAVLQICRSANAKLVTKGKSMIGEEIAINDFLEQHGITPVETDLGEY